MTTDLKRGELVVDLFAGGGGASEGIARAIGRDPDIAINHDAMALAMHAANHPSTRHYQEDIWAVDPVDACAGSPVGLMWASPDCKHFSKAKGGKPRDKNIRALAGVIVVWAEKVTPRVIAMENVEEFETWGPLDADGYPIKERAGETFREWWASLEALGYHVEKKQLRAADYGAPTIRKRLFIIARRDGEPIVWPEPTHEARKPGAMAGLFDRLPYRTAAECIDWSKSCPIIFERARELAPATMRRIARGIDRYVINAERPFIVPLTHQGGDGRVYSVDDPLHTVTGAHRGEMGVVAPIIAPATHGAGENGPDMRTNSVEEPLRTIITRGAPFHLVAPTLVGITHNKSGDHITDRVDQPLRTLTTSKGGEIAAVSAFVARTAYKEANGSYVNDVEEPLRTLTAQQDGLSVVTPFLSRFNQNGIGSELSEPIDTVMAGAPRFGLTAPVIVPMVHDNPPNSVEDPLATVTTQGNKANVVAATMVQTSWGEREGQAPRALDIEKPLGTIMADGGKHAAVAAFLAKHNGTTPGHETSGSSLNDPTGAVTAKDHHSLAAASLVHLRGTGVARSVEEPLPTTTSGGFHVAEVRAFLMQYHHGGGQLASLDDPMHTATSKDRLALGIVMIGGEPYQIVDIGMRMLDPEELFLAQGFPRDYVIAPEVEVTDARGKKKRRRLTKTEQIRMCGNSVCPPVAEAIVAANVGRVEAVAA